MATDYSTKISTYVPVTTIEWMRAQCGARSNRAAIDAVIEWVCADPSRMAELREYVVARSAELGPLSHRR